MPRRFATKGITVPNTGVSVAHGLGQTPDEYWINQRGAPGASGVFLPAATAVDGTNVYVSAAAAATADVFAAVNHTIVL